MARVFLKNFKTRFYFRKKTTLIKKKFIIYKYENKNHKIEQHLCVCVEGGFICVCIGVCIYTCVCIGACMYGYVCMYKCVYIWLCVYIGACMYDYMCMHRCVLWLCICIGAYIYVWVNGIYS